MLRWIRRLRASQRPHNPPTSRRPAVEGLEDRVVPAGPPSLDPIGDITLPAGKTRILQVTASDADNNPLTYTITSDNPLITTQTHTGNHFIQLVVSYTPRGASTTKTGTMIFELFNDLTPRTAGTIENLVTAGFYNNLTFHRLAFNGTSPFVIQGGDPNGDGSGGKTGPGFPFDDEFNPEEIFTGDGQLAMANSGSDTNSSQFFVTFGAQRHLDFHHTIFGQLVRGFDVRDEIINVDKSTGDSSKPRFPVTITSATVVQDTTDRVLTVKASGAASGHITVTVDDGKGGSSTKVFNVTASADTTDDPPFLGPIGNQSTNVNTPIVLNLTSTDLEGSPVIYTAGPSDPSRATVTVNGSQVTIVPAARFSGPISLTVGVRQATGDTRVDSEKITLTVVPFSVDPTLPREQQIVAQIYITLFGRTVDPSGLATFSRLLQQGRSAADVARIVQASTEFRTAQVNAIYQDLMNRPADRGGLQSALTYLAQGGTLNGLRTNLMSSAEYFQRNNSTSAGFLGAAFQNIFGRPIDTSGTDTYTRLLGLGFTREEVVRALLSSEEARRHRADVDYQAYLGRAGDAAGLAAAAAALGAGLSEDNLIAGLATSAEAAAKLAPKAS